MKRIFAILLILMTFISCRKSDDGLLQLDGNRPKRYFVKQEMVHPDSIKPPKKLQITQTEVIKAQNPSSFPIKKNYQSYPLPTPIPALAPLLIRPGENGIPELKRVLVSDTFAIAGFPTPTEVKDPYQPLENPNNFAFFTRKQGLQHDDISQVTTDLQGNMWIGTYGAGAVRFDGKHFYHFTTDHGLSQSYILSVMTTENGNVWLGSRAEGAMRYDGSRIYYYNTQNGLPDNRIEKIFEDSKGNIWFGTYQGVSYFDGVEMIHIGREHGLGADIVYSIQEDFYGNIWFGTRGGGIAKFDGQNLHIYNTDHGLPDDYIVSGAIDRRGNLWFGFFEDGAVKYDGTHFHHYTKKNGLSDNHVRVIAEDRKGDIWIGTTRSGFNRINSEGIRYYDQNEGLINSFITSFHQDRNGKIWFGSYGGGLGLFKGNIFTHFSQGQGLPDSFIRSILEDHDGNIWLGSNNQGVFIYNGEAFLNYNTTHGLSHNRVGGLHQDKSGRIWFATTGGGISVFDGAFFTNYHTDNGLISDFILSVTEDSKGNLWFATRSDGILKFDGNHFYNYTTESGLSDNFTRKIIADVGGNIWIAGRSKGITLLQDDNFFHFNSESGLPIDNILDVISDYKGNIWVATNGNGVLVYDGDYFTHFKENDGLVNDFVYALLEDHEQNIWLGTRIGISKFIDSRVLDLSYYYIDTTLPLILQKAGFSSLVKRLFFPKNDSKAPISHQTSNIIIQNSTANTWGMHKSLENSIPQQHILFKNYTDQDGFMGMGANSRAMFEDSKNRIWIGANDILSVYDPKEDTKDTVQPIARLTHIGLFDQPIDWQELINKRDTSFFLANGVPINNVRVNNTTDWYNIPEDLSLAYNNNFITFSYVGLGGSLDSKIKYRYMLKGLEYNWNPLTHRTEVSYGNLKPGKYVFSLKAVNPDGVWSEEFQYTFVIRPAIWNTWWAKLLYFIAGVTLLYYLYERHKTELRKKDQEREKELLLQQEVAIANKSVEFKQNFLANMSHEIRTPLTGMLGMTNILKQLPMDQKAKEYVDDLEKSGEALRETINMILDISKIEAGKLQIKENIFSLKAVFNECTKLFEPLINPGVTFNMDIDKNISTFIKSDEQRVKQIIKNLVSNAVKFTKEGSISLSAQLVTVPEPAKHNINIIKINVCDTGVGISEQDQKMLFTPFYQSERNANRTSEGTGLGLAICKELAILLGGQIHVRSTLGKGSCFDFTFKAQKSKTGPTPKQKQPTENNKNNHSLRILLVEDKPVIQKVVGLMLEGMGHNVMIAPNGLEALNVFEEDQYDLILMDIQMPLMDGVTATRQLKANYSNLPPIVGLSANAFEGDKEKYMAAGMDDYLTKPIQKEDFTGLMDRIKL